MEIFSEIFVTTVCKHRIHIKPTSTMIRSEMPVMSVQPYPTNLRETSTETSLEMFVITAL